MIENHNIQPTISGLFECRRCGNQLFDQKLVIGVVSALTSPTGREEYVPMPHIICERCGVLYNPQTMQELAAAESAEGSAVEEPQPESPPKSNIIQMPRG